MWKLAELCAILSLVPAPFLMAQTSAPGPTTAKLTQEPSYSLQVQSRLVVEDITVLDRKGNPVAGLPASAFHVFDNDHPQALRDFRELHGRTNAPAESTNVVAGRQGPVSITNAGLFGNQGTVVALLIDPSTMSLEEQMYLRLQALKFIDNAPSSISIAVFRVNNFGVPVLLQSMTRDRAQLRTAIAAAVPMLTRPTRSAFRDAVTELKNISDYLRPVPGRKAVLWLAGRFPLYEPPDYGGLCGVGADSCGTHSNATHLDLESDAFRALEEARIAVYPIDVRGVMMGGLSFVPIAPASPNAGADAGGNPGQVAGDIGAKPTSETESVTGQYDEMDRLADATGGRAFYSNNNVAGIMRQALLLTTEGYAVTYRPQNDAEDGKWHKVTIRVDGPYQLQYRNGYYASKSAPLSSPQAEPSRRVLTAAAVQPAKAGAPASVPAATDPSAVPKSSGSAEAAPTAPETASDAAATTPTQPPPGPGRAVAAALPKTQASSPPLIFSAHLLSQGNHGKAGEVAIRYVIPTNQLFFGGAGAGHAHFRLAALAYNANGDVLSHAMEVIDTRYSPEQMRLASRIGTPADQTVPIAKGAKYLLLAVEDLRTGKVGTVQLPVGQIPTTSTRSLN